MVANDENEIWADIVRKVDPYMVNSGSKLRQMRGS
jgi:hypothetical protein